MEVAGWMRVIRNEGPNNIRTEASNVPAFSSRNSQILKDTELFLHISVSFFPVLGLLCILRYSIQGVGFTNLAMLSGVSEMIARIMVSLYAVPILGYLAVCFGDPTAWIFAVIFLIPAFIYVYGRIKRMSTSGMVKY